MQFLIETLRPELPAMKGRQVALCPSLADVRAVASASTTPLWPSSTSSARRRRES